MGAQGNNEHILVAADAGTYNVRKATCGQVCFGCDGFTAYGVTANGPGSLNGDFDVLIGNTQEVQFLVVFDDDLGDYEDDTQYSSWSSSDTGVASVTNDPAYDAEVHGNSGGTAFISASDSLENPPYVPYQCFPAGMSCPITEATLGGDAEVNVRVPTASRITETLSSDAISGSPTCASGQAGWFRQVQKIVTDQDGSDIVLGGQTLTEQVTVGSPNDLGISGTITGSATTDANGHFNDTLFVCSSACPGSSGQTDATQTINDTLPSGFGPVSLSSNTFVYKCTSITINGQ